MMNNVEKKTSAKSSEAGKYISINEETDECLSTIDGDEKIKSFVEEKVNQSALLSEEKVSKLLQKHFSLIRRNTHYKENDSKKDRGIDFLARHGCYVVPPTPGQPKSFVVNIELVVECKKAPNHAWVFSGDQTERTSNFLNKDPVKNTQDVYLPEFVSSEVLPEGTHVPQINHPLTDKLFSADGYVEIVSPNNNYDENEQCEIYSGGDTTTNFLRRSILQLIKSSRQCQEYEKREYKKWLSKIPYQTWITIFQPVIVFDGLMYRTRDAGERLDIEPINFARIKKQYLSEEHPATEGEVHIVSIHWLDEYLEMMKRTYQIKHIHEEFHYHKWVGPTSVKRPLL